MCPSKYNRFSDRARYWSKIVIFFIPPLHSTPPLGGFRSEYHHPVWCGKTRMVWLPDSEKISKIFLFVLAQLTNVTDGQTDGHRMPTYTALMHMHLAVKTTRMHQKSPFGDLKSKHFLGRGHCPSPDPFLSWERDTPSPHLTPSAPTVPRLSRLRRSTSAFDVPHPHYFFTHPQSSFSRNMPVDMSISFDTIQACDRQTDRRTDRQMNRHL